MHNNHSQAGEPRTGVISKLEMQQGTAGTHKLESQGQAPLAVSGVEMQQSMTASHSHTGKDRHLSAELKHSKA